MWLWPRMRDTASWPSTHFLNDDNPHLLNLWEICSLILTYTPIWQGAPRLCGYHPPLKIDLAKWRGGRQFLNVLNGWLFGFYVKFGYRLIPSIGWMEDVHQTPTISYEVGKSVVCCKKLFPWTSPWRQLPAGCPLGRSRELQPKKAQSLLDTYERKCEEFGGLRSQDTRRLQFVCIQFYVYSTCVYIYIHTHKRAWVQDQSLSMALTLNDPAPWMLFPPLTLVLCDSGRDKQPPKLDGWLLKVNKHVAPLTLWPLMFESSAKATEMSPSMPPFASRQRSMMLGVQGNRDQPSTWVHGHFQVPLSWSQVDPSWPWVDPGRA